MGRRAQALDRAHELAAESIEVLLQRGRVNILSGKTDAGLADFSEALRIDPDNVPALLLRAEAEIPDHLDEALEDLNRALDLRPGLVPALWQRAALHAHAKKFAAAVSDLEVARKLEPTDDAASLQLAAVLAADGKLDRALGVYNDLLQGRLEKLDGLSRPRRFTPDPRPAPRRDRRLRERWPSRTTTAGC